MVAGVRSVPKAAPAASQKGGDKTTYAVAFGPDGKPVTDMTKDEFALREDGATREIVSVKQATDPLDLVLIIDTSKTSSSSISDLRAGLDAFAKTLFAGSTPINMSICDSAGAETMVAQDKKTLDDVIKPLDKTFADQTGNTVILEALTEAAGRLAKSHTPRRAIVVVNMDGIPEGSDMQAQDVLRDLFKAEASLWVVTYQNNDTRNLQTQGNNGNNPGKGSRGVGTGDVGQSRDYVLTKAPGLGGVHALLTVPTDLTNALTLIGSALTSQYAVTYARPDGPMPKQVQMGDTREGVKVFYSQIPVK